MSRGIDWANLATALGCGLSAGVFFAFSSFVMQGLNRLQPGQAIAAMNGINESAVTPAFMTALFGTALACVGVGIYAVINLSDEPSVYMLIGSALYLVGPIGLTIAYHVPMNDRLATVRPDAPDAAGHWSTYFTNWTAWNHARTAASLAAAAMFTVALSVS
jgi:uncharacterized membrane protein